MERAESRGGTPNIEQQCADLIGVLEDKRPNTEIISAVALNICDDTINDMHRDITSKMNDILVALKEAACARIDAYTTIDNEAIIIHKREFNDKIGTIDELEADLVDLIAAAASARDLFANALITAAPPNRHYRAASL